MVSTPSRRGILLVLALTFSLLAGVAPSGSVSAATPYHAYFPWVANGAMLGTMGPFSGAITVVNIEAEQVTLYHQVAANLPAAPIQIPAFGSLTLTADTLGVPPPGAGVTLWAYKYFDFTAARIAATLKVASPAAPVAPPLEAQTSSTHITVDGHTAMTEQYLATEPVLPIVQTNSGWNTIIRATNAEFGAGMVANIGVQIFPQGPGDAHSFVVQNVPPGGTATFDLLALGVPEGYVGSALLQRFDTGTPIASGNLVAIAERYKASTNMLLINPAIPPQRCNFGYSVATLVFDNYHNWNTGISIFNNSPAQNNVTVTIHRMDGSVASTSPVMSIPPWNMDFIYTPANGQDEGFVGAAMIKGTQSLCAMVDEVKYTGDQPDVGHAMSYPTTLYGATAGESLVLPLAQRGTMATGQGDTTGIQLFNFEEGFSIIVDVEFRDQAGEVALLASAITIPSMASATVYVMSIALPDGFQGSAHVTAYGGDGQVTAVSNNVNYAVQYDGSASFPLVHVP